jgi:hypothetical protein
MLAQRLALTVNGVEQCRMTRHESIDPVDIPSLDREADILDLDREQAAALAHEVDGPASWRCAVSCVASVHVSAGGDERVDDLAIRIERSVVQTRRASVVARSGELWMCGKECAHLCDVAALDCTNGCQRSIHTSSRSAASSYSL